MRNAIARPRGNNTSSRTQPMGQSLERANCPTRLARNGRWLNHTGPGRSPGSQVYVDPGRGEIVDVYFAKIVSLGPQFGLATVANNSYLPSVRVDHGLLNGDGPLRLGQILLIGALVFDRAGPRAQDAWPVTCRRAEPPMPVRKLGMINDLKPGYGFIQPADGGPDLFFHFSQCRGFSPMAGMTVEFAVGPGLRGGLQAIDLRPR